ALTVGSDESRRHRGHAALNRKPPGLQELGERGAAACFVQAELRGFPDDVAQPREEGRIPGDEVQDGLQRHGSPPTVFPRRAGDCVRFWVRRPGLEGLPKSVPPISCNTSTCTPPPQAADPVVAGRGVSPWHEAGMAAPRMLAADKISAASIVAMKCRHEGETRSVIQLPYKFHDGSGERGPGFRV